MGFCQMTVPRTLGRPARAEVSVIGGTDVPPPHRSGLCSHRLQGQLVELVSDFSEFAVFGRVLSQAGGRVESVTP